MKCVVFQSRVINQTSIFNRITCYPKLVGQIRWYIHAFTDMRQHTFPRLVVKARFSSIVAYLISLFQNRTINHCLKISAKILLFDIIDNISKYFLSPSFSLKRFFSIFLLLETILALFLHRYNTRLNT